MSQQDSLTNHTSAGNTVYITDHSSMQQSNGGHYNHHHVSPQMRHVPPQGGQQHHQQPQMVLTHKHSTPSPHNRQHTSSAIQPQNAQPSLRRQNMVSKPVVVVNHPSHERHGSGVSRSKRGSRSAVTPATPQMYTPSPNHQSQITPLSAPYGTGRGFDFPAQMEPSPGPIPVPRGHTVPLQQQYHHHQYHSSNHQQQISGSYSTQSQSHSQLIIAEPTPPYTHHQQYHSQHFQQSSQGQPIPSQPLPQRPNSARAKSHFAAPNSNFNFGAPAPSPKAPSPKSGAYTFANHHSHHRRAPSKGRGKRARAQTDIRGVPDQYNPSMHLITHSQSYNTPHGSPINDDIQEFPVPHNSQHSGHNGVGVGIQFSHSNGHVSAPRTAMTQQSSLPTLNASRPSRHHPQMSSPQQQVHSQQDRRLKSYHPTSQSNPSGYNMNRYTIQTMNNINSMNIQTPPSPLPPPHINTMIANGGGGGHSHGHHGSHPFSATWSNQPAHPGTITPSASPRPPQDFARTQSLPRYQRSPSEFPAPSTRIEHYKSEVHQRPHFQDLGSIHQMQISESYSHNQLVHAHSHRTRYTSDSRQYGLRGPTRESYSAYSMHPQRAVYDEHENLYDHDPIIPTSPSDELDEPPFPKDHNPFDFGPLPQEEEKENYSGSESNGVNGGHFDNIFERGAGRDGNNVRDGNGRNNQRTKPRRNNEEYLHHSDRQSRMHRENKPTVKPKRISRRKAMKRKMSKRHGHRTNTKSDQQMTHKKYIPSKHECRKKKETEQLLIRVVKEEQMFQDFDDKSIKKLVEKMYRVDVPPNRSIIREGDSPEAYFVVERGILNKLSSKESKHRKHRSRYSSEESEESHKLTRVLTLKAKSSFGQENMLYAQPHQYTYRAGPDPDMNLHADADSHHTSSSFIACRCWALDQIAFQEIRDRQATFRSQKSNKVFKFLKDVSMFHEMSDDALQSVADEVVADIQTYKMTFDFGTDIVSEGDSAAHFFIIYRGTCTVTRLRTDHDQEVHDMLTDEGGDDNRVTVRKEIGPSDFFGELGIIKKQKRGCTVTVTSENGCVVYAIPKARFEAWFENYDEVNKSIKGKITEYTIIPESAKGFENRVNCKLSDFEHIGVLGVGAFGRVSLVMNPGNDEVYALKRVSKNRIVESGQQAHILNEKKIMAALDSKFCIKLFATYTDELNVYFLLEPVMGGELFSILRQYRKIGQRQASFYSSCVVLALEHLHCKMNVIYRDLKPENLLIAKNGYCKLVDFGFAKTKNNSCTLCGTPQYMAPEVIRNDPQGFAVDWWSFGILIYEMIYGYPPFIGDEQRKMYQKILSVPIEFPKETEKNAQSESCRRRAGYTKTIIKGLLQKRAHKRLGSGAKGIEQIKSQMFFRHVNWERMFNQQEDPPFTPEIRNSTDCSYFDRFPNFEEEDTLLDDPDGTRFKWCEEF